MSHIPFLCKLVTPLIENVYFAIAQLIVHIAQQLRCLTHVLRVQEHYKTILEMCLIYVIAQNIAAINEKFIFRHSSANIKDN